MSQMQSEMAKAKYNESLTKKLDLDYYNEIDGTTHNRNLEVMSQQAQAQADKSAKEKYMDFNRLQEKYRLEKELQEIKNKGKINYFLLKNNLFSLLKDTLLQRNLVSLMFKLKAIQTLNKYYSMHIWLHFEVYLLSIKLSAAPMAVQNSLYLGMMKWTS